jgi:hypothetical protein
MRFLKAVPSIICALVAVLGLAGCSGYTLGPIKPTPMKKFNKVAVRTFKNDTLEPRMSSMLANALIKQIQQDGTYEVTDEGRADVIIDGTLLELERRPARSLRGNVAQTREYLLNLRGRYRTTNARTGALIEERSVTGSTSFFVTGRDLLVADTHQDQRQALPLAAEDFATRVTSLISEGW